VNSFIKRRGALTILGFLGFWVVYSPLMFLAARTIQNRQPKPSQPSTVLEVGFRETSLQVNKATGKLELDIECTPAANRNLTIHATLQPSGQNPSPLPNVISFALAPGATSGAHQIELGSLSRDQDWQVVYRLVNSSGVRLRTGKDKCSIQHQAPRQPMLVDNPPPMPNPPMPPDPPPSRPALVLSFSLNESQGVEGSTIPIQIARTQTPEALVVNALWDGKPREFNLEKGQKDMHLKLPELEGEGDTVSARLTLKNGVGYVLGEGASTEMKIIISRRPPDFLVALPNVALKFQAGAMVTLPVSDAVAPRDAQIQARLDGQLIRLDVKKGTTTAPLKIPALPDRLASKTVHLEVVPARGYGIVEGRSKVEITIEPPPPPDLAIAWPSLQLTADEGATISVRIAKEPTLLALQIQLQLDGKPLPLVDLDKGSDTIKIAIPDDMVPGLDREHKISLQKGTGYRLAAPDNGTATLKVTDTGRLEGDFLVVLMVTSDLDAMWDTLAPVLARLPDQVKKQNGRTLCGNNIYLLGGKGIGVWGAGPAKNALLANRLDPPTVESHQAIVPAIPLMEKLAGLKTPRPEIVILWPFAGRDVRLLESIPEAERKKLGETPVLLIDAPEGASVDPTILNGFPIGAAELESVIIKQFLK
jgi:hypothetical protein